MIDGTQVSARGWRLVHFIFRVVSVTLMITGPALGVPNAVPQATPIQLDAVNAVLSIRESTLQTPVFVEDMESGLVTTTVLLGDEFRTLQFRRHTLRSDDFKLLVQYEENGPLVQVEPDIPRTVKGGVAEDPGARVRGSYHEGRFDGVVITNDEVYAIQSLVGLGMPAPFGEHVVYRDSDWFDEVNHRCGVTPEMERAGLLKHIPGEGGVAGTGQKITDLGVDADFEFYVQNGSNVNSTLADMENVVNVMESRYEVPTIAITFEITTAIVRTASGAPYTSSDAGTLLDQFRSHWSASPQTQIRRDIAELFTGKDISVSPNFTIGIAWLSSVCNAPSGFGYSVVESRFTTAINSRAALSAHEIGHNYSAGHCNGCSGCSSCCRIMCSSLGGCSGLITSFGCTEEAAIVGFRNGAGASCLSDLADPQPLPFFEDFPSGTIAPEKWSYNNGGLSTTSASNEVSPTFSLNLDAAGSGQFQKDEIRTNFILFGGQTQGTVSYHTQHQGVEVGEQLVVEYFGTNNLWNELNRVTSNGVNQSTFTFHSHSLPSNAFHNEFRLRFRTEVNEVNDDWFIDDVLIASVAPASVVQHPASLTLCQGAMASFSVTASGTPPISYQWKKNGANIGGATGTSLVINPANPSDAGSYTCVVSNALGSSESNPATLTVVTNASCNDGLFCNGMETCVNGACVDNADPCPQACKESTDTCQPFGTMSCELAATDVPPGGTVDLELYLSQVLNLAGYQAQIAITPISGTGTVSVSCPEGVAIDDQRADFVFTGQAAFSAVDCPNLSVVSAVFNPIEVPVSARYLATYQLEVSMDATPGSVFQIALVNDDMQTFLREGLELPIPFNIAAPCILTVAQCASAFGDIKTPFDGLVTIDDILCVLNGFSSFSSCVPGDIHPCFGNGSITLDDILWVLAAFGGADYCCGGGGGASAPGDSNATETETDRHADVPTRRKSRETIESGPPTAELGLTMALSRNQLMIDAWVTNSPDLRGFEISLDVRDAAGIKLAVSDLSIDGERKDYVFKAMENFAAIDLQHARMAGALLTGGVDVEEARYLGSFVVELTSTMSRDVKDYHVRLRPGATMLRNSAGQDIRWTVAGNGVGLTHATERPTVVR